MSDTSESGSYRPTVGWYIINLFGAVLLVAASVGLIALALNPDGSPVVVAASGIPGAIGIAWIVCATRIRIRYDSDTLTTVGWLRTVRIPRRAIREVDPNLRRAAIEWQRDDGAVKRTPLTAVSVGEAFLPPTAILRRQRELIVELARWAHGEA